MLTCYSFVTCGQHLSTFITVMVLILTAKANIPHLNFFAMLGLFCELSEKQCLCLPTSIRYIIDVRTALQRMETFLNKHEDSVNIDRDFKSTTKSDEDVAKIPHLRPKTCPAVHDEISPSNSSIPNPPYLQLHKVTCQLPSRVSAQPSDSNCAGILKDVTLSVTSPALVLVCGPVGSGKSLLLATVLGEFLVTNGSVKYSGTLG